MSPQEQWFPRNIKLIQETRGKWIHIYPEGGEVYSDQTILTTKDRIITTIVRASDFPTVAKYYKRVKELLASELDYRVTNGVIPGKLSPCKKGVSA